MVIRKRLHWGWLVFAGFLAATTGGAPLCEGAESLPPVVTVYATGLDDPRGMTFGPDGTLYVTEAGVGGTISTADQCPQTPSPFGPFSGGYTGRVSRILPDGTRTTVVDGLPSAQTSPLSGNAILGPEEVVFLDGILYVLLQAGGCETSTPRHSARDPQESSRTAPSPWSLI
jgi:hypothetical protein